MITEHISYYSKLVMANSDLLYLEFIISNKFKIWFKDYGNETNFLISKDSF